MTTTVTIHVYSGIPRQERKVADGIKFSRVPAMFKLTRRFDRAAASTSPGLKTNALLSKN